MDHHHKKQQLLVISPSQCWQTLLLLSLLHWEKTEQSRVLDQIRDMSMYQQSMQKLQNSSLRV